MSINQIRWTDAELETLRNHVEERLDADISTWSDVADELAGLSGNKRSMESVAQKASRMMKEIQRERNKKGNKKGKKK